ncbi:MAG: hypothetical protein Fur0016_04640 [Anaerolineales bacterium]
MSWIADSLTVLSQQWSGILRLLAFSGIGGLLTFGLLRRMLQEHLDTTETFLLAMAGWPLWWVLSAFLGFFLAHRLELGPGWGAFLLSIVGLLLLPGWKKIPAPFGRLSPLVAALLLTFLLSLFSRLAFLSNLLLPSYFDGALHYQISQYLLTNFGQWPWDASPPLVSGYYHIGFHLLTASAAFVTNLEIGQVILLLGQFTLAVLPFPVFLVTRHVTESTLAAFFALILAGWGWNMPAHALNWGKYPALAGLLALQFALAVAFTSTRTPSRSGKISLLALFIAGVAVSSLTHTRSLVIIFIFVFGYFAAIVWERLPGRFKWAILVLLIAALAGLVVHIESRSILNLAFDPYLRAGFWITLLIVALSPFALRRFERLSITCLLVLWLLLVSLLIPLPGESFQTPLDRPFVQMILYLPLALLGGLGLAGLRAASFRGWQIALTTVAVFSAVFASIGREYPFSASPCCILFKTDDAIAFDWMEKNLPADANLLIAGNTLNVFDIEEPGELRGTDGGIWIAPLTGRRVSMESLGLDFSAPETRNHLCQREIAYLYIGGTPERFNLAGVQSRPAWYAPQLNLPEAQIFKIIGCR